MDPVFYSSPAETVEVAFRPTLSYYRDFEFRPLITGCEIGLAQIISINIISINI